MKSIEVATIMSAWLSLAVARYPIQSCMNCLDQDTNAGFLYSYSYCKVTRECVADEWNKLNAWCDGGWTEGFQLDLLEDCLAFAYDDPIRFESSNIWDGQVLEKKLTLLPGFYQDIEIDASQYVGRVLINETAGLGIQYMGYKPGTWLQVDEGTILRIRIFNAMSTMDKLEVESIWFSAAKFLTVQKFVLAALTLVGALATY